MRKYVEERGLGHILTKLYGVWDNADIINFDELPAQFAIKMQPQLCNEYYCI